MSTSAFVLIILKRMANNPIKKEIDINKDFKKEVVSVDGVESIYMIGKCDSPYNAIIKVSTPSMNELHKIVIGKIAKIPCVKETKTMIIIEN